MGWIVNNLCLCLKICKKDEWIKETLGGKKESPKQIRIQVVNVKKYICNWEKNNKEIIIFSN